MKIIMLFLFLVSSNLYANSIGGDVWATECKSYDQFAVTVSNQPTPLVINDNQIVISIISQKFIKNKVNIFFYKTLDLGRGGMIFDWANINANKPLAELTMLNDNEGVLKWYGFFNVKKRQYLWVKDPDFIQTYEEDSVIKLHKCDDEKDG